MRTPVITSTQLSSVPLLLVLYCVILPLSNHCFYSLTFIPATINPGLIARSVSRELDAKNVFLKFHLLGKRRGLIKYDRKIERNTLYLLVKKDIFFRSLLKGKKYLPHYFWYALSTISLNNIEYMCNGSNWSRLLYFDAAIVSVVCFETKLIDAAS